MPSYHNPVCQTPTVNPKQIRNSTKLKILSVGNWLRRQILSVDSFTILSQLIMRLYIYFWKPLSCRGPWRANKSNITVSRKFCLNGDNILLMAVTELCTQYDGFYWGSIGALYLYWSPTRNGALLSTEYRKYPGLVNIIRNQIFRQTSGGVMDYFWEIFASDCLPLLFSLAVLLFDWAFTKKSVMIQKIKYEECPPQTPPPLADRSV